MEEINTLERLMTWYIAGILETEKSFLNSLESDVYPESSEGLKKTVVELDLLCRKHIEELKKVVETLPSMSASLSSAFAMNGISLEFNELMGHIRDDETANAAILVYFQTVCHYKIAAYGSASSFARILGNEQLSAMLHHLLVDEKALDESLSKLAEANINLNAIARQVPPHTG